MNSLRKKLIGGLVWSLADKFINQLGYLAVTVYLARYIGPESFGFVGMLTVFILLCESVVNNGFSQALVQRSHKLTEDDCSTIFYVNLIWGIVIYIVLYYGSPLISKFYNEPLLVDVSRVLFFVVVINSLAVVVRAKLIIDVDFKSQTLASTCATVLSSILSLKLVVDGYGYWSLVWLVLSKSIFMTVGLWYNCHWVPSLRFSIQSFKSLFKFGSNLMFAGLVSTLVNNLYIALIGRYYNASQVGYFTQATNLSNYLMQFLTSTFQGVTYPILTSINDDREKLLSVYKRLMSITSLISLPMLVGFAAISHEVVLLFLGEEWLPSVPVLMALCFARTITPISTINMNILNAVGRSDLFLKVDLCKLPMILIALFISLPYGITTIAWSMTFTSFISFFINAHFPGRMFNFGAIAQLKIMYKYVIACTVMFASLNYFKIDNLASAIIIKIAFGIFVYFICLYLLRDKVFLEGFNIVLSRMKSGKNKNNIFR